MHPDWLSNAYLVADAEGGHGVIVDSGAPPQPLLDSVGGVRAPGSTTFADLKASVMDVLMKLPRETVVYPGHTESTTIGDEWEQNAFVRVWRGLDEESSDRCRVQSEEATLVLWGPDYDGGHKAWVRWE